MSSITLNARLKNKRDTHSNWLLNDPVLLDGEIAIVDTTDGAVKFKIGDGIKTYSQLDFATLSYNDLTDTPTIPEAMVVLSYGNSTWQDFLAVYNTNRVVYCRASSNSNPASGSQTRMAFMAYVNNATNPTEVEFQYYRSVSSHSASQQGDQVYIYKLTSANKWTVTIREAMSKIAVGTGLSSSYSNGTITLSGKPSSTAPAMDGTAAVGSSDTYARADHVHPTDTSRAAATHTHSASDITSGLATVATSGSYNDLSDKPSIHNVPSGGTSGQVLTKASGTDYDASWEDAAGSGSLHRLVKTESGTTDSYGGIALNLSRTKYGVLNVVETSSSTSYVCVPYRYGTTGNWRCKVLSGTTLETVKNTAVTLEIEYYYKS